MEDQEQNNKKNILDSPNFENFIISGNKKTLKVEIQNTNGVEIASFETDRGNILDDETVKDAIRDINNKINTQNGGKRSSSKSRKTQLRDEHGRFLPSNKRKMVRRKTARRTMQKTTNPMNTIMTTTLV